MSISAIEKKVHSLGVAQVGGGHQVDAAADAPALDGAQHRHPRALQRGEGVLEAHGRRPEALVAAAAMAAGVASVRRAGRRSRRTPTGPCRSRSADRCSTARGPGPNRRPTPRRRSSGGRSRRTRPSSCASRDGSGGRGRPCRSPRPRSTRSSLCPSGVASRGTQGLPAARSTSARQRPPARSPSCRTAPRAAPGVSGAGNRPRTGLVESSG